VTRLLDRAVFVTFAPLALAGAALGIREWTRAPVVESKAPGPATAFVPPPLFLAATSAPGVDQSLRTIADQSYARVAAADGNSAHGEQRLRAEGSVRILADESLADLELNLVPRSEAQQNGWPRDVALHLRGVGARSHTTGVPGVRACSLRCAVTLGGIARETTLAVTWIRLPGGVVQLQAVATLDRAPFDLPANWVERMLPRDEQYVLGLDLVLRADG